MGHSPTQKPIPHPSWALSPSPESPQHPDILLTWLGLQFPTQGHPSPTDSFLILFGFWYPVPGTVLHGCHPQPHPPELRHPALGYASVEMLGLQHFMPGCPHTWMLFSLCLSLDIPLCAASLCGRSSHSDRSWGAPSVNGFSVSAHVCILLLTPLLSCISRHKFSLLG